MIPMKRLFKRQIADHYVAFLLIAVTTVILSALSLPKHSGAAVFNCSSGDLNCLIQSIADANNEGANPGLDAINLDGSTFTLNAVHNDTFGPNGLPAITSDITINGNGSIIERDTTDPDKFRLFYISPTGNLTLNGLTVQNGLLPDDLGSSSWGGGIFNLGTLHLMTSTVTNNRAGDDSSDGGFGGVGGGILHLGTAHVTNSTISNNRAGNSTGGAADDGFPAQGGYGGGIFSGEFLVEVDGTVITTAGVLNITNSTISGNRSGDASMTQGSGGDGAGISAFSGGELNISNSTIDNNTAGKGFGGGDGGGISIASDVVANIVNSTFVNNAAGGFIDDGTKFGGFGGAIDVGTLNSTVNITNCTFSGNLAGLVTIDPDSQIPRNGEGGAISVNPRAQDNFPNKVNIKNTILSDNFQINFFGSLLFEECQPSPSDDIIDMGYNIETLTSCGFTVANNSQPTTDAGFFPGLFGDHGGPTKTIALCTGDGTPHAACSGSSPALDAIPNGTNGCGSAPIDKDQRGVTRPMDGDGDATAACDIGAYEAEAEPETVCGDGMLEGDEECDDGNTLNGDCCSATCAFESSSTVCRPAADACDVADTCTGSSATCPTDGFQPGGTACGDATDTECNQADTCDGAGSCQANLTLAGTACGDAGSECVNQDTCDGAGTCTDNGFKASGSPCGSSNDTACDNPDTCDGGGGCQTNNEANGTPCNDGNTCTLNDACAEGACVGNHVTCFGMNATICGDRRNNVIFGTNGPDVIHGLGGNDVIFGQGGNDKICGGDGNDLLFGGSGNDKLDGGSGNDMCIDGFGHDTLTNCKVKTPQI